MNIKKLITAIAVAGAFSASVGAFAENPYAGFNSVSGVIHCPDPSQGQIKFSPGQSPINGVSSNATNVLQWKGHNSMTAHGNTPAKYPWRAYYPTNPYVFVGTSFLYNSDTKTTKLTCAYGIAYGAGPYDYQYNGGQVSTTVPGDYISKYSDCGKDSGWTEACTFTASGSPS